MQVSSASRRPRARMRSAVSRSRWSKRRSVSSACGCGPPVICSAATVPISAIWLGRRYWGHGYMTEALRGVVAIALPCAARRDLCGANLDHLCLRVAPFDASAIAAHLTAHRHSLRRGNVALRRRGPGPVHLPARSRRQRRRAQGPGGGLNGIYDGCIWNGLRIVVSTP